MINDKSMLKLTIGVLTVFSIFASPFSAYASLAEKYPGDIGIESDPNVVFVENFEELSLSTVLARWESVQNSAIMSLDLDTPTSSSGNNSILIAHVEGQQSGYLYRRLLPGYDQLYLRFYVKFATDCHLIHHFVHMGGYNPSTSWPQGGAGTRPVGNERLTTGVEPMGSSWRWDFYSYWMEMRGNPNPGTYWGNDFINDSNLTVVRGDWICVELMMKMNYPTTERNGEQAIWIDGQLWQENGQTTSHLGEGFPNGYWLWDSWHPDPGSAPFEGFRWRSDATLNLNFLWLLAYITTNTDPGHINKVWFDDVVVAKEYVGPISELTPEIIDANFVNYAGLASHWKDDTCVGPDWCDGYDYDNSGSVDANDLAQFATYWTETHELLVVEAEDYTTKTNGSGAAAGSSWDKLTGAGSSGTGYMQALPDSGLVIDTNIETESPQISYQLDVPKPENYYLWIKGWTEGRGGDSVHYGLDGSAVSSDSSDCAFLSHDGMFTWKSSRADTSKPTVTIDSSGPHTLNIWMRKDGARLDRLLLTTNPNYVPDPLKF
ncbi:MAG: hypothetical protein ACYS1A_11740 [Planctomycetota bacterium]